MVLPTSMRSAMTEKIRIRLLVAALVACVLAVAALESPQDYERRDGQPGRTYVDWRTGVLHELP